MSGKKNDLGKLQWHLLPLKVLEPVVRVLMHGAKKYAPDNWQRVDNAEIRYADALMRHYTAWMSGERIDIGTPEEPGAGDSHLACIICSAIFLLHNELYGTFNKRAVEEKGAPFHG